jgi:hypothetical protein
MWCGSIKTMGYIRETFRDINPWVLVIAAVTILTGCDAFSPDTYWSSGDYALVAIDTKGQMINNTRVTALHNQIVNHTAKG